jgi:hypothetical protein
VKKVETALHVSELPTEVIAELGNVEIPEAAREFDGEYQRALKEIEQLMAATAGTPEGARLDALVEIVGVHESACYPMGQAAEGEAGE